MTEQTDTHITVVVDRSGSMSSIREDAEGGLRTFLDGQRAQPGRLTTSVFQVDTEDDEVVRIDGMENASREWTREQVLAEVRRQRGVYGWTFVYAAANQDAIAEGGRLGFDHATTFETTGEGVRSTYDALSASLAVARSGESFAIPTHT